MNVRQRFAGLRQLWPSRHALLAIPVVLIAVITVVDLLLPADVHLGPLLVIAPAITASFAGPRLTAVIGVLAVAAQAYIGWHIGALFTRNVMVQILALAVLSFLTVLFCVVRERHRKELAQVRSVAEAAQHVLLWPLPDALRPTPGRRRPARTPHRPAHRRLRPGRHGCVVLRRPGRRPDRPRDRACCAPASRASSGRSAVGTWKATKTRTTPGSSPPGTKMDMFVGGRLIGEEICGTRTPFPRSAPSDPGHY